MLADPTNKSTWSDLYGYLPCLRQMLSCCVCGNIMLRPKGPSHGICAHHVCASCIGGKMRLRPVCSWCRTHEGFVENRGLRFIVLCFTKMCRYINSSAIGQEIRKAATNGAHTNTLIRVLDEAAAFEDDYVISNKVMPACVPAWGMAPEPKLQSVPRGPSASKPSTSSNAWGGNRGRSDSATSVHSHNEKEAPPKLIIAQAPNKPATATTTTDKEKAATANVPLKLTKLDDEFERMPALLAPCTRGILSQEKLSPPLPSTRADVHDHEPQNNWAAHAVSKKPRGPKAYKALPKKITPGAVNNKKLPVKKSVVQQTKILKIRGKYKKKQTKAFKHDIDFEPPCKRTRLASSLNGQGDALPRKICKCARLNAPSRLTCFGQRCPCYSSRLPCVSCMCRGCRNPRKESSLLRNADEDKSD